MTKTGIAWSKWKVAPTIWPYPEGHGVYKENYFTGERVILDTGIPKEEAEKIAKELNNGKRPYDVGRTTNNAENSGSGEGEELQSEG